MLKNYFLLLVSLLLTDHYTYCMERDAFLDNQEHESTVPSKFNMLLTNVNEETRQLITALIKKLQELDATTNPHWPILLFADNNELVQDTAIQLGHEIARTPQLLTHENFCNKEGLDKVVADTSKKEPYLWIFSNFNKIYRSYKQYWISKYGYANGAEYYMKHLIGGCATNNPLIIVDNSFYRRPLSIHALFNFPSYFDLKKIIIFAYSEMYRKEQAVIGWCKKNAIDYVYTVSPKRLPPGLFKQSFRIMSEATKDDEIIDKIIELFRANNSLARNDWEAILNKVTIKKVTIEIATQDQNIRQVATIFKVLNESGTTSTATVTHYKAAINLDHLKELIDKHCKK